MSNVWSLAWRNVLRNRRRSLATVLTLAIGSTSILIFGGFSENIRDSMLTFFVRAGGHLQIQHRDFFLYGGGNPTEYGIVGYSRLIASIREDPVLKTMVTVVSPTLQLGGIAGNFNAGVSRTVIGFGLVPADINRMREWNERSLPGGPPRFVLEGASSDSAIVGIGLARVLLLCESLQVPGCQKPSSRPRVEPEKTLNEKATLPPDIGRLAEAESKAGPPTAKRAGARLELLAGQGRGTPNVTTLQVIAAEEQGFKEADEVKILMHFERAQSLIFGRAEPRATALMVQLRLTSQVHAATERLKWLLTQVAPEQPLTVMNFETLNPFYQQTMDLFDMIFTFIFVLIGGIVLFTVGNAMTAAVVERTIEIGTLRSIGLRRSGILILFIAEGLILGATGTVTGLVVALLSASIVNYLHLTWLPPGSSERLPLFLNVSGAEWLLIVTIVGLVAIASISAWLPARRAARLRIVDALRHT